MSHSAFGNIFARELGASRAVTYHSADCPRVSVTDSNHQDQCHRGEFLVFLVQWDTFGNQLKLSHMNLELPLTRVRVCGEIPSYRKLLVYRCSSSFLPLPFSLRANPTNHAHTASARSNITMACSSHDKEIVKYAYTLASKVASSTNLCIRQLLRDSAIPLKIRLSASLEESKDSKDADDSKHPESTYHVPRSLLASVSPKLVDTCSRGLCLDHVGEEVMRMFVTWLLYQKLDVDGSDEGRAQTQLAQAWNFGAYYEVPAFQDKVMRKLIKLLNTQRVYPDAVVEAYRPLERGSLLQKAFVQQLASDMEANDEGIVWTREDFTSCALGEDSQFLLDLQFAGAMGDVETLLTSAPDDA